MTELVWILPATFVVAAAASVTVTALALAYLRRRGILAHPNERSSHSVATPTGGGLAVVPVVLLAWFVLAAAARAPPCTLILLAALALALVSWRDDLRGLGVLPRLAAQALAIAAGLAALPAGALVFQGWLPLPLDRLAAGLAWLGFTNLVNFMDGIDGLTGAELACLGLGLALVALLAGGAAAPLAPPALALAGAGVGFLTWNWPPARVFLGDAGSVPLGYLAGWLLLGAAARGLWLPALILPLYYLADGGLTLARRLLRGERVWQAHCEHFYQRAVRRGLSHGQVVRRVLAVNGVLIAAAAAALAVGALALVPAGLAVGALLRRLAGAVGEPAVERPVAK